MLSRRPSGCHPRYPPDELLDEIFQDDDAINPDPLDQEISGKPKTDAAFGNRRE
jgi:hypothetical protein